MDLSQVKKRLNKIQNTQKKSDLIWKPEFGKNQIRIVPWKENPDFPFIELLFHYGFNSKTYLSPKSFGRPDPIVEFADKLKSTGDKEDWKAGRKLEPKLRTFVPVVVRGKENEGVKLWGFGKTVYEEILAYCADDEIGDIEHPTKGRDLTIEYIKPEDGKQYPTTRVRPKLSTTKLHDDTDKMKELLENQPDISSVYEELSYDELKSILENALNPTDGDEVDSNTSVSQESLSTTNQKTDDDLPFDVDDSTPTGEKKVAEARKGMTKVDDVESQFDDLFNS